MRKKYGTDTSLGGDTETAYTHAGEFRVADMTTLPEEFPKASFDVVVDKCSVDALTVDPGDMWDPNEATRRVVDATLQGVAHVLRPGGVFFSYTFNQPHFRRPLLQASDALFDIELKREVDIGMQQCFVFVLRRK